MLHRFAAAVRARLVADVGHAWRWFSVQLHAFMLLWMALYEIAPVLPAPLIAVLPSPFQVKVQAAYAVLGIVLRLLAQRKKPNGA